MPIKTKITESKEAVALLTQTGFMKWAEGKDLEADDIKPEILRFLQMVNAAKVKF